jgi:hypothetical protein
MSSIATHWSSGDVTEPLFQIACGEVLSRIALQAIAIHLHDGGVFQPIFEALETEEGIVTKARLVALQLVRPARKEVLKRVPRTVRRKAHHAI